LPRPPSLLRGFSIRKRALVVTTLPDCAIAVDRAPVAHRLFDGVAVLVDAGDDVRASTWRPLYSTVAKANSDGQEAAGVSAGVGEPWPRLDDDVARGQFDATPIARVQHLGVSTAVAVSVQQEWAVGRHVLVAPGT